jgi:hypothetical protein
MEETAKTPRPSALKHYLKLTLVVLVLAAGVCVVAYFQAEIKLFIKMKAWDRQAPANVVVQFLTAAKEGNLEATAKYVKAEALKPVQKKDQSVGYASAMARSAPSWFFSDLLPAGDLQVRSVRFQYSGQGGAVVEVPGKSGAVFAYTLGLTPSGWLIMDLGPAETPSPGEKGPG